MTPQLLPSGALLDLLEQSGELENLLDGRGLRFDNPPAPPVEPPPPFIIEPPNWEAEEAARKAIAQERHRQELQAELQRLAPEDTQTAPAPKRRRPRA